MKRIAFSFILTLTHMIGAHAGEKDGVKTPPPGFVSLFNGKDLTGWKDADKGAWTIENGTIHCTGKEGKNLATAKNYKDFELFIDWKITAKGDSGIYLRGQPQVKIWSNKVGSGGLSNNKPKSDGQEPLYVADKKPGEWNHMYVKLVGTKVSVVLNGKIVVDNAVFLDGKLPADGPIELQVHSTPLWFRNVFVREIPTEKK